MSSHPVSTPRPTFLKLAKGDVGFPGVVTALLFILFIVMHLRLSQYAFDDAYIHFRVARHLLDTGTPYFNTDEIVKVSTSSGWTLFLAILLSVARGLGIEHRFPAMVSLVNAGITLGGMMAFTRVMETLIQGKLDPVRKILFQITYFALLVPSSIGLMETPLALLLAGAGILDILRSKPGGFFWIGLAAYTRVELVVLLAAVSLLAILRGKKYILQACLSLALGLLPLLLYDLYFFGTIIPQSIRAKSVIYILTWLHTLTRGLQLSFPVAFPEYQLLFVVIGLVLLIGIPVIGAVVAFRNRQLRQSQWIAIFLVWSLGIFGVYVAGETFVFEWYTPLFIIPLLLALILTASKEVYTRNTVAIGMQFIPFLMSIFLFIQFAYAALFDPGTYVLFENGARVKTYLQAGKILYEAYPDATLLTSEIGGLGYAFQGKIQDAVGLASPDALQFHPMDVPAERYGGEVGAIPPEYVEGHQPELIVSFDIFAQALLASDITRQYNMVLIPAYLPEDFQYAKRDSIWGNRYLRIYVRKDIPLSEEITRLGIHRP